MNNSRIDFFREAAPYIDKHRGKIFVIAFAGEVIECAEFSQLIEDIAILSALGTQVVLVHGARPQIDTNLEKIEHEIQVVDDMRITDDVTLQVVKEAIGALRVEIENQLSHALSKPPVINESLGVLSGNFITAQPLGIHNGTDYQHTGTVRKINASLIKQLTNAGNIVLLSSLGFSPSGEAFNLRYEDVASFAAKSLQADKLIFLHDDDETANKDVDIQDLDTFIEKHPAQSKLLNHIKKAMHDGVERVHLISTKTPDGLLLELYTRDGIATMFNATQYENIRPAIIDDVSGIIDLIEPLETKGILIKRSREQLELEISNFVVIERDEKIIACAALYNNAGSQTGELACVAVHADYKGGSRGDRLLRYISQIALQKQLRHILVLTTQSTDWFKERGFVTGDIEDLPAQKKALYNFQRNSKILIKPLGIKT